MPTILAKDLVERARTIIQDETEVRWPDEELLDWLNDGQREIVLFRPDASTVNENLQLVAGSKQTLAASHIRLMTVVRNMGIDGATVGRAIRPVAREVLDASRPDWHSANPNAEVKHAIYDYRDPKTFYVFPPQPTGAGAQNYVELVASTAPADCTINGVGGGLTDSTISLDDVYANALIDYQLYRAYLKDAQYAGNANRATAHYNAFLQSLGIKTRVDLTTDPNVNAPPEFTPGVSTPPMPRSGEGGG